MERDRFRRGVVQRRGKIALDPCGAHIDRGAPVQLPDLAGKGRDGGFAIGAGDRNHLIRLRPEPQSGGIGQRLARVFGNDDGDIGIFGDDIGGDARALGVGQDRTCLHPQGILDELAPMHPRSGQGRKQKSGFDCAAIDGQTGDLRLAQALCGQSEFSQGFRTDLPHDVFSVA